VAALCAFLEPNAHAESLVVHDVRLAMTHVETLLVRQGIDVTGYAATQPPQVAIVPPSDPVLRGNDGGYVNGRVYVNAEAAPACGDLVLVHELVHDVTVKHRLFTKVSNAEVRDAVEALADSVTAAAADEPYRPGCLPRRRFGLDAATLAAMAAPTPPRAPEAADEPVVYVFFAPRSARMSREARALLSLAMDQAMVAGRATIVCAELSETAAPTAALGGKRAFAVQRALKRTKGDVQLEIVQRDGRIVVALVPSAQPQRAFASIPAGVGEGLMAP
jgi:hypothetical protein